MYFSFAIGPFALQAILLHLGKEGKEAMCRCMKAVFLTTAPISSPFITVTSKPFQEFVVPNLGHRSWGCYVLKQKVFWSHIKYRDTSKRRLRFGTYLLAFMTHNRMNYLSKITFYRSQSNAREVQILSLNRVEKWDSQSIWPARASFTLRFQSVTSQEPWFLLNKYNDQNQCRCITGLSIHTAPLKKSQLSGRSHAKNAIAKLSEKVSNALHCGNGTIASLDWRAV